MTMNKITAKLRKKNQSQYRVLGTCIFLSVLLLSAFAFMYFSPTVQEYLPEGGDTRKLAWLMFAITIVGCTIFTIYGANLFFKYKSREFGVFLALGEQKKQLAWQLAGEISVVILLCSLGGIVLGLPASYGIWKIFRLFIINTETMQYRLSFLGVLAGVLFTLFLTLCILAAGTRFIRRANIMDILNDQRKSELAKEIKPWTGKLGVILIAVGLFLAMGVPAITVELFMQNVPPVWNATYLLSVLGIYLFMLSAVGRSSKGRHKDKYYKNIISTNLMRFTARQTTRNMCVITLLVFVTVVAGFYGAMYYDSAFSGGDDAPYDFSFHSPAREEQITLPEIEKLAEGYDINITHGAEAESLQMYIRYVSRDMTDAGKYFDIHTEKLASFLSVSEFERISGMGVSLKAGEYMTVVPKDYVERIWVGPDCLEEIENPVSREILNPSFRGTVEFENLALMSEPFLFILSDEDYNRNLASATDAWKEDLVLFNVDRVMDSYAFAEALIHEYAGRATELSDHWALYDAREEELAQKEGREYYYSGSIGLSPDDPLSMQDWKYGPFSKILLKEQAMQRVAVFVLLSVYISIISLAATAVMSYVRSLTIAMDNRKMFGDLRKLGANQNYIDRAVKMQLRRIFAYPTLAGGGIALLFSVLLSYFNDNRIMPFEIKMLCVEMGIAAFAGVFICMIYRISLRKVNRIISV